jgi:hypothetical protein
MDGLAIASAKAGRPLPIRNDLAMLIVALLAAQTMPAELYARIHEPSSSGSPGRGTKILIHAGDVH